MGRPSKFKPEFVEQARKLAKYGATVEELADFFEVSVSTVSLWKVQYEDFSEAINAGREIADRRVEESLYRRACGYSHDAVKVFMPAGAEKPIYAPIAVHYPPDPTSIIFWLCNRKPDAWKRNRDAQGDGNTPQGMGDPDPQV